MSKPRTALVKLRLPWLYDATAKPGDSALLTLEHLKAARRLVRKSRKEGLVTDEDAKEEILQLNYGIDIVKAGPLGDVGAWFPKDCVPEPRASRRRRKRPHRRRK